MVSLREDPCVAAGHGAELDDGAAAVVLARVNMRDVPFERHAMRAAPREPQRARRQAVHPVGADRDGSRGCRAAEAHRHCLLVGLERRRSHAVAEVGAGHGGLLRQVRIQPPPLRHQDQRLLAAPLEAATVAEAELEAPDRVLDHRLDRDGQLPHRAIGEPAAARLVPRKALAVEQEHARARARETEGGGRSRGTGSDDDCIEALHWSIVRPQRGRRGRA
jgi:hypothetical protein